MTSGLVCIELGWAALDSIPMNTLIALAKALSDCQVEYTVVGGVAISLGSRARYTADVDAVLWEVDQRLPGVLACLASRGFRLREENAMEIAKRSRVLLLEDPNSVGIDLSMGVLPFERWMIDGSTKVKLADVSVPIASPEALVVMKAIAWRPKDLEDIRVIVAAHPHLDKDTILTFASEFLEVLERLERMGELGELLAGRSPK
jgi:hypothetical protein